MIRTTTVFLFGRPIGVLRLEQDGYCSFEYTEAFCNSGLEPAPLQMPTQHGRIFKFPHLNQESFNGLPGMIADSLPDSFGQAILEQWLVSQGRGSGEANALEKLSFQGNRCMGALEYKPARKTYLAESSKIELEELIQTARLALRSKEDFKSCLENSEQAVLDILKIGTSAGGQRAKAVIAINGLISEELNMHSPVA